jgi:hypothetical protein
MSTPTNLDCSTGLFEEISPQAWARGSALAIELLEECDDLDRVCMCDEGRGGAAQDNVLYRYLLRLRREASDDPQVEMAFCSVLSDYIGAAPEGAWDVDAIEKYVRESGPVRQAVRP